MKNLVQEKNGVVGKYKIITYKAGTKEILRETPWQKNLIMLGTNTGKTLILQRLAGINTYSLNITHLDIGTGTTSPAVTDTALTTAVARASTPVATIVGNTLSLQFFLTDAELANGSYKEIGTFVDGSAGLGTGKIFNHALFGVTYVKATGEDTTIQVDFSLT